MTERRDTLTIDEQAEINDEPDRMKRMALILRLVEAAYERGWQDAEEQWTAYVDTLETPVARA